MKIIGLNIILYKNLNYFNIKKVLKIFLKFRTQVHFCPLATLFVWVVYANDSTHFVGLTQFDIPAMPAAPATTEHTVPTMERNAIGIGDSGRRRR